MHIFLSFIIKNSNILLNATGIEVNAVCLKIASSHFILTGALKIDLKFFMFVSCDFFSPVMNNCFF